MNEKKKLLLKKIKDEDFVEEYLRRSLPINIINRDFLEELLDLEKTNLMNYFLEKAKLHDLFIKNKEEIFVLILKEKYNNLKHNVLNIQKKMTNIVTEEKIEKRLWEDKFSLSDKDLNIYLSNYFFDTNESNESLFIEFTQDINSCFLLLKKAQVEYVDFHPNSYPYYRVKLHRHIGDSETKYWSDKGNTLAQAFSRSLYKFIEGSKKC